MDDDDPQRRLSTRIGRKASRRMRARARQRGGVWFALGFYGVVGWSIVLPTVAGLALGLWIDRTWPAPFSWTLTLLVLGLVAGCWNAWRWIALEQRAIDDEDAEHDDE